MIFKDRIDAAKQLVNKLQAYKNCNGIVLAVPRGGVPLGELIAKELHLPLDLLLSKKIGHPMNKEYAIGAVTLFGHTLNENANDIDKNYIESAIIEIKQNLKARQKKFMGDKNLPSLKNKIAIIVDDGIATGQTLIAGIKLLREQHPDKIVVAVPVAAYDSYERIAKLVDDIICLHTPEQFDGVGAFYENFEQVSDEEVIAILNTH